MTPISALNRQATIRPGRVVFVAGDEQWTYRRLATEAARLAHALLARGVRQGDRVALHMANLPELVIAYYACFCIGAIASPLNIRFKTAELRSLLQRLRPVLYLGQAQLYPQIAAIEPAILGPNVRFIVGGPVEDDQAQPWADLFEGAADQSILHDPDVDSPAVLLTTSGTTGQPKLVAHTPATLSAITDAHVHLGLDDEQTALNALPMVQASGFMTLLACVRFGAPMVLVERFDPDAVLDAIDPHRCSWLIGLPFMIGAIMERQRKHARKVDSLRFCLSGGNVCPVRLQQDCPHVLGVPLRSFLVSAEAYGTLTYGLRPGPVSRVVPGTEVRLVDDDGRAVPRGEVGELLVRGPNVTVGYWSGPGRIDDAAPDGWFHTGDLVREGEEKDLWFVSHKRDPIIRVGSTIPRTQVERVLMGVSAHG